MIKCINELFEYLMEEDNIDILLLNSFIKISDYFELNSLGIYKITSFDDNYFYCENIIFCDKNNLQPIDKKIKIDKKQEYNKVISNINQNNTIDLLYNNKKSQTDNNKKEVKLEKNDEDIKDEKIFNIIYYNFMLEEKKIISCHSNKRIENKNDIDNIPHLIKNIFIFMNKIRELDKKKINFIMNMSHEIRTPLNAIVTMCDLISKSKKKDEKIDKFSQIIKMSSVELINIFNNMLDYSKVVTNSMRLKLIPMSLLNCIKTVLLILENDAKEKNLDMSFKIDNEIPDMIICDNVRIKQLLINILSNSIKFTKEGFIKLFVKCLNKDENKCEILFKIIDTGIGIDKKNFEKIFDYFVHTHNEYFLYQDDGLGVGLSISKHIVKLFKGDIWVENNNEDKSGTIMNIKIKFNLFNDNINQDLIKDYFFNNTILTLDNNQKERINIIKYFSSFKINPIITMSIEEMNEYLKELDHIDIVMINYDDIKNKDTSSLSKINDSASIILLIDEEKNIEENILYDYKIKKPMNNENIINALKFIYTINKYKKNDDNEIIDDKKERKRISSYENMSIEDMKLNDIKILVVEDNKQNLKCMLHILEYKKFSNIESAKDGEEALKKLNENKYDLVLMDIKIPVYDGITVTEKFKETHIDDETYFVAVTAGISEEVKNKCFKAKMNAFLSKPIDINCFDKIIKTMYKKKFT